jgi:hypothetical protein
MEHMITELDNLYVYTREWDNDDKEMFSLQTQNI